MSEESVNQTERLTVKRNCAGGCGVWLTYALEPTEVMYAPDMYCLDGNSRYRGGHLCDDCDTAVEAVLTARRQQRQAQALPEPVKALVRQSSRRARKR